MVVRATVKDKEAAVAAIPLRQAGCGFRLHNGQRR
jgi:hypothetical protein